MKIAFDIGGVLSKYPTQMWDLIATLTRHDQHEIFVITDQHPKDEVIRILEDNKFLMWINDRHLISCENIHSADYEKHGNMCKAVLCKELGIDIFIDDFLGYLDWDSRLGEAPIRLLVMPDNFKPYWADEWQTHDQFDFGRRKCDTQSLASKKGTTKIEEIQTD